MPHIVRSDAPPVRKGWDAFDREVAEAFDREVERALEDIGHPARFDEVAEHLPAGVPYGWILNSLRAVAEFRNGHWQIPAPAPVVELPSPPLTVTTRKAA